MRKLRYRDVQDQAELVVVRGKVVMPTNLPSAPIISAKNCRRQRRLDAFWTCGDVNMLERGRQGMRGYSRTIYRKLTENRQSCDAIAIALWILPRCPWKETGRDVERQNTAFKAVLDASWLAALHPALAVFNGSQRHSHFLPCFPRMLPPTFADLSSPFGR